MKLLKRKVDKFLIDWKNSPDRKPLIIKGARQIGKTVSIKNFAKNNYKSVIEINFVLQKQYKDIFDNGFEVDTIIKNISLRNPDFEFIPGETLIFFDELQDCINCATSLKSFNQDGRYDVICSGSLMGINYNEIESNSVGNKEDYEMYSMDFEEFLWVKGYKEEQIENLYEHMINLTPLSNTELSVMFENFEVYRKIPTFLGNENKKFQISKVEQGARNREYVGTIDWLNNAGIIKISILTKVQFMKILSEIFL